MALPNGELQAVGRRTENWSPGVHRLSFEATTEGPQGPCLKPRGGHAPIVGDWSPRFSFGACT